MGKIKKDSLGDRQKQYEAVYEHYLIPKLPFIIRVDGKAFHTYTRGFKKPFDDIMGKTMLEVTKKLCEDIPGAIFGFTQSDEITIVCRYTDRIKSQAWFGGRVEKIVAITASKATKYFNKYFREEVENELMKISNTKQIAIYKNKTGDAEFDSRVFNIPEWDCINNVIWRQQDTIRNSVEMVGHANFSAKELNKVNCDKIKEKLLNKKGINWENDFTPYQKYGACCYKKETTTNIKGNTVTRNTWFIADNDQHIIQNERDWFSSVTGLKED